MIMKHRNKWTIHVQIASLEQDERAMSLLRFPEEPLLPRPPRVHHGLSASFCTNILASTAQCEEEAAAHLSFSSILAICALASRFSGLFSSSALNSRSAPNTSP